VLAAPNRLGLSVLLIGLALIGSAAAPAQVARPTVTLLTPANGSLLEGAAGTAASLTFTWRVDGVQSSLPGSVTVTHRTATDPTFTNGVTTTSQTCPAQSVNCWTSATPRRFYEGGRYYWQVAVSGAAVSAISQTWMFQAAAARPKPDRLRPRVQALTGAATRGRKAVFVARVADDRGEARMQVELLYRHQLVFRAMTLLRPVRWSVKQRFDSRTRLPHSLPPGRYRLCVTAWDRTGNRAWSCAAYRIR
jgi:hypothetical protein